MKTKLMGLLVLIFGFVLFFLRLILISVGLIADGEVLSFAVDSGENIYIGTLRQIRVYHDGEPVRSIRPPTSRPYRFYIEEDTLILGFASGGKVGIYDLEGKELSRGELSYSEVESRAKQKSYIVNGHEYAFSNAFGLLPWRILRDGVEVQRMSGLDYLFNGPPFWIIWILLFFLVFIFVIIKVSVWQEARLNGTDPWKAIF